METISFNPNKSGKLYIVATPIGNYDDISSRAINTLKNVDLILAEDTRRFGILKKHFGIETSAISFFEHNETGKTESIIRDLKNGKNIALVSDAGTPLISDPGYKLVKSCRQEGISVTSLPGPSAITAALSISGLETDRFIFLGFFPQKDGKRRSILEEFANLHSTLIFYESPHRVIKSLSIIAEILPLRPVVLCRELTKIHEEVLSGTASEVISVLQKRSSVKGECVILVGKNLDKKTRHNEIIEQGNN